MLTDGPEAAVSDSALAQRWSDARRRMAATGAVGVLLSGGADLAYLSGYQAMPLERITAFVARLDGGTDERASLLIPALEAARVQQRPDVFSLVPWGDTDDPVSLIAEMLPSQGDVLVSDDLWALHALGLQRMSPELNLLPVNQTLGGLRAIKSRSEREALVAVGGLADAVARQLQDGQIPLVGRSEADIADDIAQRLVAAGHNSVEFVIVASGPNAASPHHHPGSRIVQADEIVLCDFGGRYNGFCSDTTRCVYTGSAPAEVSDAYTVLQAAQEAAFQAARPGRALADVDLAARNVISEAGYGEHFIHRTGHGIGTDVHEHPYVTETNRALVEAGHAFSIEPGIYLEGKWGMRLEDIVVIEPDGARRCNNSDHTLREVLPHPPATQPSEGL